MVRTSHKATKSTGGPAPRKELAAPALDTTVSVARPKKRKRAATDTAAEPILTFLQLTLPVLLAANAPPSNDANKWCSGCEDGGQMYICELCFRCFCKLCIQFPVEMGTPGSAFYCPKCWFKGHPGIPFWTRQDEKDAALADPKEEEEEEEEEERGSDEEEEEPVVDDSAVERRAGPLVPYRGVFVDGKPLRPILYKATQTLRAQWPVCDTARLAIVSLRLDGTPLQGDAASIVANHLVPYYRDAPFCFETLSFDLNTGIHAYDAAVDALADRLTTYAPEKIVIFLTTHATPEDGDLHTSKGGASANAPQAVLPRLMPPKLQQVVREARSSLLVLQVCGALNRGDARGQVAKFVSIAGFDHAIGFTVPQFLPAAANTFLQDTILNFFLTAHAKKFHHVLATHYELGIHTNIIMYFTTGEIFRYCWTHPLVRPYGHPVPHQCPRCYALAHFKLAKYTEYNVSLACTACEVNDAQTLVLKFKVDKDLQRIDGKKWEGGERHVQGVWYGKWLVSNTVGKGLPLYTLTSRE
ncbi:hypothetical protein C8R46DRAFT_1210905 [Mycena filopes]|nr:hypothetical protein C8R46DRAFT_1210905 [Mycena filopes]